MLRLLGLPLQADTYAKAARAFPDGNVHELETAWRTWLATKSQAPAYPDAAFLAFCKKKAGRKPLQYPVEVSAGSAGKPR